MTKLRIVSWNCCMSFRKKYAAIVKEYNPDILVIPECENPAIERTATEYKNYKEFAVKLSMDTRKERSERSWHLCKAGNHS